MKFSFTAITAALVASVFSSAHCKPTPQMPPHEALTAIVSLSGPNATVSGTVTFNQADSSSATQIFANLTGLTEGKHGLHIHQFGDLSNGCASLGPHYNPFNHTHGGPEGEQRHAGDFGNIIANADGTATLTLTIDTIHLSGPFSILGRGIVLHSGEDDLGLGNSPLSNTTGNSGERSACGVIGYASAA
ncbi:conserved hypothetical protein [Mucor ambiguus]|uniref:Superoxide dismutase [Cu-Zn] n=1 Tax=Mucor ambiguus TaxID=91626 RepID=A0A0C9MRG5_9FUNG|nr:conserved hypothetical protein [Mucor ambiguus]